MSDFDQLELQYIQGDLLGYKFADVQLLIATNDYDSAEQEKLAQVGRRLLRRNWSSEVWGDYSVLNGMLILVKACDEAFPLQQKNHTPEERAQLMAAILGAVVEDAGHVDHPNAKRLCQRLQLAWMGFREPM